VELEQLRKRVLARYVGVENEERRVILGEDFFGEFKRAGGAKRFVLDGEGDGDAEFFRVLSGVARQLRLLDANNACHGAVMILVV